MMKGFLILFSLICLVIFSYEMLLNAVLVVERGCDGQ